MMYLSLLIIVISLFISAQGLKRNSICKTPNNEEATCIPILSCNVILSAIKTRNETALNFAKASQCGYDSDPLVCCGSSAFYSESVLLESRNPVLLSLKGNLLPSKTECGFQKYADRIVGGTITGIDEFPWMVLLKYNHKMDGKNAGFKCGGTLINNRYVLTAAHCMVGSITNRYVLDSVRLGEWDYNVTDDCIPNQMNQECADPVKDVKIDQEIPHAFYSPNSKSNDIGLLRLVEPVQFTEYIRPICLPSDHKAAPPIGKYMTVTGWGLYDEQTLKGVYLIKSTVKRKVDVPIAAASKCNIYTRITPNQICAGGEKGKDSCNGDSGGPLMYFMVGEDGAKQWYEEGIVSFGPTECGGDLTPAVYTRTARYMNWILSNLRE